MVSEGNNVFWYVLFAAGGKAVKIGDYFKTADMEYFFPLCWKERHIRNSERTKRVLHPLIGNLIFVKSTKERLSPHIQEIQRIFNIKSDLYYRDLGSKTIITVPENQMLNFISVAGVKSERLIYLSNDEVDFAKGRRVRITGGVFEGVEGIFMRIKGDRRVVVGIPALFSVATAFVPLEYILPLEE